MKQKIENAQKEIDSKKMIVQNGKMRQHYHFMPQSGWMNDPRYYPLRHRNLPRKTPDTFVNLA